MTADPGCKTTRPPIPNDVLKNDWGDPLKLFHGTTRDFLGFQETELRSVGFHFGDPDQANHFAPGDAPGARIFPVYLRCGKTLDVTGSDFGWLKPKATALCLFFSQVISLREMMDLLDGTPTSMVECANAIVSDAQRSQLNLRICALIGAAGYDSVLYTNKQEPPDGKHRPAYFALSARQIISALTHYPLAV